MLFSRIYEDDNRGGSNKKDDNKVEKKRYHQSREIKIIIPTPRISFSGSAIAYIFFLNSIVFWHFSSSFPCFSFFLHLSCALSPAFSSFQIIIFSYKLVPLKVQTVIKTIDKNRPIMYTKAISVNIDSCIVFYLNELENIDT